MVCWLVRWFAGWLVGWLAGWLVGWLAGWLVGWLAGWLVGWFAGSLVRLLAGSARLGLLLLGIEVALKCTDPARGSNCLFLQEFELIGFDLTRIQCGVQVGLHLRTRSARNTEEMPEFIGILSLKPLGDIGHHRNRRSLQLIPETEIPAQVGIPGLS